MKDGTRKACVLLAWTFPLILFPSLAWSQATTGPGEFIVEPPTLMSLGFAASNPKGVAPNPWHFDTGNMFAGSILNLEPDAEHECRFVLSDLGAFELGKPLPHYGPRTEPPGVVPSGNTSLRSWSGPLAQSGSVK